MSELVVAGIARRPVSICGIGLLCPAGIGPEGASTGQPGKVPGFRARNFITQRKSIKLMTRAVQLGVAGVGMALDDCPDWQSVDPARRGMFIGASPQTGDGQDLRPALERSFDEHDQFSYRHFAEQGFPLIHPLWLVRGLSNNILGFASAIHDFQGTNMNYCDGIDSGWNALSRGARAVVEGAADLVVAGGADMLLGAEALVGDTALSEGAAFVVFKRAPADAQRILTFDRAQLSSELDGLGLLGAASGPIALARWLYRNLN